MGGKASGDDGGSYVEFSCRSMRFLAIISGRIYRRPSLDKMLEFAEADAWRPSVEQSGPESQIPALETDSKAVPCSRS